MKFLKKLNKLNFLLIRRVEGQSMLPSLSTGQLILAVKYKPVNLTGRVVICRYNQLEIIKRVKWANQNELYVLGDNPEYSRDSRFFGPISRNQLIGLVIWPKI